ncbi:DUF6093 family protein [Streptomyces sp. NPDC000878]
MTTPAGGLPLEAARRMVETRLLADTVRFFLPGEPYIDPDTLQEVPGEPTIIWEGAGAIQPDRSPDVTVRLNDGTGTPVATSGRYRMLTPVDAPVAKGEHSVTLTASGDADAVGRIWEVDSVERSSTPVVRVTWLTYDSSANDGS